MAHEHAGDDELLAALLDVVDVVDPVPASWVAAAAAAPSLVALDAELLALVEEERAAGMRAEDDPGELEFRAAGLRVDVTVAWRGGRRVVEGHVSPPTAKEVEVESPATAAGGRLASPVDELGHFRIAGVPGRRCRLVVVTEDGRRVPSSWVVW
jgi:hypothetical protein